jgi:hypothetical protein
VTINDNQDTELQTSWVFVNLIIRYMATLSYGYSEVFIGFTYIKICFYFYHMKWLYYKLYIASVSLGYFYLHIKFLDLALPQIIFVLCHLIDVLSIRLKLDISILATSNMDQREYHILLFLRCVNLIGDNDLMIYVFVV